MRKLLIAGLAVSMFIACGSERPRAGSGAGSTVLAPNERCNPGDTRACHVETGRHDGVVNCFSATQACGAEGAWGPCAGAGTISVVSLDQVHLGGGGDLAPLAVPPASQTGAACSNNPCDPYCWGWDVDAGVTPQSVGGSIPSGVLCDANYVPANWRVDVQQGCTGTNPDDCFIGDTCCSNILLDTNAIPGCGWSQNGKKQCVPATSKPPGVSCSPICVGMPDFTLGPGCRTNGEGHFPLCNRGTVPATTGTLRLGLGIATDFKKECTPDLGKSHAKGSCDIDLAALNIPAGDCIDINIHNPGPGVACTGVDTAGNIKAFINELNGVAECTRCNNWSGLKTNGNPCVGGTPPPLAVTESFSGTCIPGYHPRWNQLAWVATIPSGADVKFEMRTAPVYVDGGTGTFTSWVTVADPPIDGTPATCALSGPSPCPVLLPPLLGAVPALYEKMELRITLTSGAGAIPTLSSYQVTYDCIPYE